MKYIRRVLASLRKADEKYGLIDNGDKILLGISGGKDSLCLLKAMSIYGKFAGKKFKLYPVILDLGFDDFDATKLSKYTASLGLELIVEDSRFVYGVLKEHQQPGKHIPCSICSRMKKAAMNSVAHRLGANKVAFAHHKDDAIETLFMNMVHGGRVATFEPKMYLHKSKITFIRPLVLATESDLTNMAREEELPVSASTCPANGFTEREFTKNFLKDIYRTHPEAEKNFEEMLSNYDAFKLYFDQIEYENPINKDLAFRPLISAKDALAYLSLQHKYPELEDLLEGGTTYIVERRHRYIGMVNFNWDNAHQVTINRLTLIDKEKEFEEVVLRHLVLREEAKSNPTLFIYKAKNKKLASKIGFKRRLEPTSGKMLYCLKEKR